MDPRPVPHPTLFRLGLAGLGLIQLTDGLRTLRQRRPIYAVEFQGKRYDTGDKLGFLKATVEFALARPDLGDDFREYLRTLKI